MVRSDALLGLCVLLLIPAVMAASAPAPTRVSTAESPAFAASLSTSLRNLASQAVTAQPGGGRAARPVMLAQASAETLECNPMQCGGGTLDTLECTPAQCGGRTADTLECTPMQCGGATMDTLECTPESCGQPTEDTVGCGPPEICPDTSDTSACHIECHGGTADPRKCDTLEGPTCHTAGCLVETRDCMICFAPPRASRSVATGWRRAMLTLSQLAAAPLDLA